MTTTFSAASTNSAMDQRETFIGASPLLRFYNGAMPADPDTALSGNTKLSEGALPADWLTGAAAKVKSKNGTWTTTGVAAAGAGTAATFYRIYDAAGTTCHIQGSVGVNVVLATNALTAVNGNVLNFAATAGVVVGMRAIGTGIPLDATVVAVGASTVTLSHTSTAGVANATSVTFKYDMEVDNANIASGQVATVGSYSITGRN
jgi:hypothetical protein